MLIAICTPSLFSQASEETLDWRFDRLEESSFIWVATERFETANDSAIPYYPEKHRASLAIDASRKTHRQGFANASAIVKPEEAGLFQLTLVTLTETDGESQYRLLHNGNAIGSFTNPQTETNNVPAYFVIPLTRLEPGDRITIQSNAVTNGKIPEGDGTAYARGRWIGLVFQQPDAPAP